jgi:hypothetical protein
MLADKRINQTGGNSLVFASVRKFALNGLSDLIRVLMENIDDALFDLSEKAETDRERNMYFEAMREIRIKRSLLQLGFDQSMESCFEELTQDHVSNVIQLDADELTLVELDDIEDNIAIDNMISKARPNFEDDLFAVSERLKVVLKRNEIDEDENPLDPKAICNSFHKASDILETDIQVKLIFYKLFDKYVMSNLGHFYKEMNDFFIEKGVLPDFKASAERMKQTTKFMANRIKNASQHEPETAAPEELAIQNQPLPAGPATGGDGGLLAVLQQALSSGGQSGIPSISGFNAGQPGTTQVSTANQGQSADIAILPVAQNAAYMSALTDLQIASLNTQPVEMVNPQNFKQEIQQQLVTFSQQNQHQTSTADNQIIDIVSMLFDFFMDDEALPDPIKVLIGRLQIPVLKAAILDNSFFNQKKHPARQLLDNISKASLGWSEEIEQEKRLIDKIESVVNYILAEFEENMEVFEQALQDFNAFLDSESEKIHEADEIVKQQELDKDKQIDEAQNAASELIAKICKDRELSFEVGDFLETIWTSVLFHTYLSLGESSNHWKNLRRISTTLIWTLVPKFSEEERIKILRTLPALLRALSKGMELVKISADAQNRIYRMLAQEHAKVVKQTTKNIVTRVDDVTIWPDEDHIADAFAKLEAGVDHEEIDITGMVSLEISDDDEEEDPDSITVISETSTKEVIEDMESFTTGVNKGEIEVDEEIILDSAEEATFHATANETSDDFLEHAQALEIGTWVEFTESDGQSVNTRLSWKSNVTGKLVFVNRQGAKVKNMTVNGFAMELRSERAKFVESSSVFDRAINTIMSTITQ